MKIQHSLWVLSLALVSSCGGDRGGCEPYVPRTAHITIHDAVTGMPIACGATVTLNDWKAPYLDDENCRDNMAIQPYLGAGDFEIVITKPGYHDWSKEINVEALNRCATLTEPEVVEVFLSPVP